MGVRRYLVTGGCGFIGTNLIRALRSDAAAIRVLDNLSNSKAEDLDKTGVELIVGDINDEGVVARAVKGVDTVIHLAAHTRVVESVENPRLNFDINAIGTFNCLIASVRAGVERFVFASTGGAIIGDREPPVHEEMAPRPVSPYGASKLVGEAYCSAFWGSYDLRTVSLRFSNIYGPFSYAKASVVAKFYKQILRNEPLVVYGDGSQTRDFLYVSDLCRAILAVCQKEVGWGRPYHIASGIETRISDLIHQMEAVLDRPLKFSFAPAQKGEIYRNCASIEMARDTFGFAPSESLRTGLEKTWEWFRSLPQSALSSTV